MPKGWRLLITAAIIGLVVLILRHSPPESLKGLLTETVDQPNPPFSYIMNAHTTQYSDQGYIQYTLKSELTRIYEETGPGLPEITFDKPSITVFKNASIQNNQLPLWKASSVYGEANKEEDEVWLKGDVVVEMMQTRSIDKPVSNMNNTRNQVPTLSTSLLLIKPDKGYAETDKPVTVTDGTSIIRSTGIRLFFDDERVEFLSNVQSQYYPP